MAGKKKRKGLVIAAVCTVLTGAVIGSLSLNARAEPEEEIIWREYEAKTGTITASLDGGGVLKGAAMQYRPGSDVHIEEILVQTGQAVKAGDMLVKFSTENLEKKLEEKKAALAAAKRVLEDGINNRTKSGLERDMAGREKQETKEKQYESSRKEKENAIASQAVGRQQAVKRLNTLSEELKKLEEQGSATVSGNESTSSAIASIKNQMSQAEQDILVADNAISSMVEELNKLEKDYLKQQEKDNSKEAQQNKIDQLTGEGLTNTVENAKADVKRKEKEVEEVQKLLEHPYLTAETDGVITNILSEPDCDVAAGTAILKIARAGERRIKTQIPQEDIGNVEEGQETEVQFLAFPDRILKGTVSRKSLVPMEGSDSVVYEVEISLDQEDEGMLEGMTAGVKFIRKRVENVLTLSNKAITLRDGRQFVTLKLPDGTHEEREITTGFSDGRVSEVKSGLTDGDIVVVEG